MLSRIVGKWIPVLTSTLSTHATLYSTGDKMDQDQFDETLKLTKQSTAFQFKSIAYHFLHENVYRVLLHFEAEISKISFSGLNTHVLFYDDSAIIVSPDGQLITMVA